MAYRQILNAVALSQIRRDPDIPDFHLMVGSAEDLTPQPITIYTSAHVPKEIVTGWEKLQDTNNETIQQAIEDGNLEVNDLPSYVHFLGIGGL